jgi:hypothetical protein
MRKTFLCFMAVALAWCVFPAGKAFAGKDKPLVLFDFENDSEFKDFVRDSDATTDFPAEKVTENATSGKYCLKVTLPKEGQWPGLHFIKFQKDWSKYDVLKVDVFNPQKEVFAINFGLADEDAGFTKEAYFGEYGKRFGASQILKPGKNTFEIDLVGATVEDKTRAVELNKVKRFAIFIMQRPDPCIIYMDNIRLEKAEE